MSLLAYITWTLSLLALAYPWRHDIHDRAHTIRANISNAKYAPVVLLSLIPTGYLAYTLSTHIPVLRRSIYNISTTALAPHITFLDPVTVGYNVLLTPLAQQTRTTGSAGAATASTTTNTSAFALPGVIELLGITAFGIALLAVLLIFNHEEETWGRDTWGHVAFWAVSHLIMGIPVLAVIPIFGAGAVYKHVHDTHGHDAAFTAHYAANTTLVVVLITIVTIT